jgi:acetyl-CoA C-acetyltransferase
LKSHAFSVFNPYAQFTKPITREIYDKSAVISAPVCLFDCSGMTDGAAALILASEERAKKLTDTPMWILGGAQSVLAANSMNQCGEFSEWRALKRAAGDAYKMAGITAKDVDIAETHDCFTISEIIEYEELGFCKKGEGGKFVEEGRSGLDGDVAVNTSGGLLSCGHPLGATSVRQAWEVFNQMRGTVPKERQRKNVEIGLTHNLSGMAQVHSILIYGKSPRKG